MKNKTAEEAAGRLGVPAAPVCGFNNRMRGASSSMGFVAARSGQNRMQRRRALPLWQSTAPPMLLEPAVPSRWWKGEKSVEEAQ